MADDELTYPPGIGVLVTGNQGFHVNSHYFNPTPETFQAEIKIRIGAPNRAR